MRSSKWFELCPVYFCLVCVVLGVKCTFQNHFQFKFHCRGHISGDSFHLNLIMLNESSNGNVTIFSSGLWSVFPYSSGNAVTVAFLLLTFLIIGLTVLLCTVSALLLMWKSATCWRRRKTAQFAEDSFIIAQCLLATLHALTFAINLMWKQWPRKG